MKREIQITATILLILTAINVNATTFRTIDSGSWTSQSSWENGQIPTSSNGVVIHIEEGHTITFNDNANNHKIGRNVTFLIDGVLNINGWGNYQTGGNTTFEINGNFTTNHHFKTGNDATFRIHEEAIYTINGSFESGNNLTMIVNGILVNNSWSFRTRNDATITVGEDGIFFNNSTLHFQNNLEMTISGAFIHTGHSFQAGNNTEIMILDGGVLVINGYNTSFGNGLELFIEGLLEINHRFSFGNNSELFLVGNGEISVADSWMFSPSNSNNSYLFVCNDAGLPETITQNQIVIEMECGTLPVELLYFEGTFVNEEVILNWATATEINSDYFLIERSFDGHNWEAIAYITSAGNSNEVINYSYNDIYSREGVRYYRLKQVDFDGAFEYFAPIAVNVSQSNGFEVASMQKSGQNITIFANFEEGSQVMVYNVSGQVIANEMISWDTNSFNFSVPAQTNVIIINYTNANSNESTSIKYMVK